MAEREPKHITQIELKTTIDDIGDNTCIVCDKPAKKTLVETEQSYTKNGQPAVIRALAPGYKCEDERCKGIETVSLKAGREFLREAFIIVAKSRDKETLENIWALLVAAYLPQSKS